MDNPCNPFGGQIHRTFIDSHYQKLSESQRALYSIFRKCHFCGTQLFATDQDAYNYAATFIGMDEILRALRAENTVRSRMELASIGQQ